MRAVKRQPAQFLGQALAFPTLVSRLVPQDPAFEQAAQHDHPARELRGLREVLLIPFERGPLCRVRCSKLRGQRVDLRPQHLGCVVRTGNGPAAQRLAGVGQERALPFQGAADPAIERPCGDRGTDTGCSSWAAVHDFSLTQPGGCVKHTPAWRGSRGWCSGVGRVRAGGRIGRYQSPFSRPVPSPRFPLEA